MSIRIKDVPPKTGIITSNTKLATESSDDEGNATRSIPTPDIKPDIWGASDEDSSLSVGILYTTEAAPSTRSIKEVFGSLKNPPGGLPIVVEVEKETAVDSNIFTGILSVPIVIDVGKHSTENSTNQPEVIGGEVTCEKGRRLLFRLITNDTSFEATGLKVGIKS